MSDNIQVVVKVRPLISRELEDKLSYQWRVKNNTLYQLDQNGKDLGQSFTFDKVYDKDTNTSDLYDDIAKPIVQAATAGFNGTIFAYGQTSSGKTYTMTGTDSSPGIIELAIVNLFDIIRDVPDRDFLVRVSYIEIYNDTVKDLLNIDKDNIKIYDGFHGLKMDATERVTSSPEEVLEAMKEGEMNRKKGATNMNEQSSRSHSIFQIIIESREHIEDEEEPACVNVSQLNLVDLAGSERSGQTGATGLRFIEGTYINKSLSALAHVIKQLSESHTKFTNYRDSKLTRILQNSLGGNAKTCIICAVTPAAVEETISTLQFGNRAKAVKNKPEVNAVATADSTMIQKLTKQMCRLQAQLESKKNIEQDNYNLQSQIANLKKLILNGFTQRHNMDIISGTRRKLQQPRRITISALPSISDNEPIVSIPKFCTPSLKYNPNSIQKAGDFVPLVSEKCSKSDSKLPAVPEEPARFTTPPPTRSVGFSDEVIDLDSDDDSTRDDIQTCSPIHKCYGATKTPPCILKRNAKVAERNLKDIIELTEREKLYSPDVVEYIEKLDHNTSVIAQLQDQIELLNKQSKEKDLEMEHLKSKIKKTEEDVRVLTSSKTDLLTQCDNYNTKLTDAEVSYETLRNKAKLREEELLSLLEELKAKNKKPEDIGNILSRTLDKELHFMDISKDISLVNSDNESIVNANDDEHDHLNKLVADTQSQLNLRNQTIIELEAKIFAEQQTISFLEDRNQNLQEEVTNFKEKLTYMENEHSVLKSTIDTLNITIKDQKQNLETANNDIDSYNSLIQELQIKLTQKDSLPSVNIDDTVLENMIANEEKFIANNENMKNIIHSLKIALDSRIKEIDRLKSAVQCNDDATLENVTLLKQLESKVQEINTLNENVDSLKKQINENITSIHKLMQEKNVLKVVEQELSEKVANYEHKTSELEKWNRENEISNQKLKEENYTLTVSIADKNIKEKDISEINKQLLKQIEEMTVKIAQLETEISEKDDQISTLKEENKESKECMLNAKAAVLKSQLILGTLSGNMQEVPLIIDNFVNIFTVLSNSLNTLEYVANDVVKQKEEALQNNTNLKVVLEELVTKHNSEILSLQEQINSFSNSSKENITLSETISQLSNELEVTRIELQSKIKENKSLESDQNQAAENIETCKNIIADLNTQKEHLVQTLLDKEKLVQDLTIRLEEQESILNDKMTEITVIQEQVVNAHQERDELLNSIFRKMTEFTINFKIHNEIRGEIDNDCGKIYERILQNLDKIGSHITFINLKNVDDENIKINELLLDAKKEIVDLTQQNLSLTEQLSQVESKHSELSSAVKKIRNDNDHLNKELSMSQGILQSLQVELKLKADELSSMESKVKDWKEQFKHLDAVMKQQMEELKMENEKLKARHPSPHKLKREFNSVITYEHKDSFDNQIVVNKKQISDINLYSKLTSPPSLLKICCDKIEDFVQPKKFDSKTTIISSESSDSADKSYLVKCKCNILSSELEATREVNVKIMNLLEDMEGVNQNLIQEQEVLRNEIQLLVAPAQELQKKLDIHKTNLSILIATTSAENKSLKLQVTALKHHHSRFHNVCQRDVPDFKKQLTELMNLLKGDQSIVDPQNASFKRYSLPDVLDSSSTILPNFKNESTLDGDLLMLDTNVTINTAADNTLTGHDQTCLDLTQFYNEASCQTNERTDQDLQEMEIPSHDNQTMYDKLNILKDENAKLRELVNNYAEVKESMKDAQISPFKSNNVMHENVNTSKHDEVLYECVKCKKQAELQNAHEKLYDNLKSLTEELLVIKSQKAEIEEKYNNLILETPSTDILIKKLTTLEKDYNIKVEEIAKLVNTLNSKSQELKSLQDENNTLSTQVFDNISEVDNLNKELEGMKTNNIELLKKCNDLEKLVKKFNDNSDNLTPSCSECIAKDELLRMMQMRLTNTHLRLNRSLSDSDTSSRYNKICTLQSELHAGKEDCKEITEDVVTIKNHLDRSNLSMDLDDSMGESNMYTFARNSSPQSNKCIMPDIPEEHPFEMYIMEKNDCFNYCAEKLGVGKDYINRDIKIIDLMKTFYEHLITKHGNEVENLTNKLKDYDESKIQLEIKISNLMEKHSQVTTELEQKDQNYNTVLNALSQIKNNIKIISQEIINVSNIDITKMINIYKDNFFKLLDNELGLSSVEIIDTLIDNILNKHQTDLTGIMEEYTNLQAHVESLTKEWNSVNETLVNMKGQLSAKEKEYNLLMTQKEKIHEISKAVTLDIIKKDKELTDTISNGYKKLIELNVFSNHNIDLTLPINVNVTLLFENFYNIVKEKQEFVLEIKNLKGIIEEKQKEIATIVSQSKEEENKANDDLIKTMTEEVKLLKSTINDKEESIKKLEMQMNIQNESNEKEVTKLMETVKGLQVDLTHLKALNDVIVKEKDSYAIELLKSGKTLEQNNIEMDKMTSDILILRESVRENGIVINNLNMETKNLLQQNMELKEQLDDKCRECLRLETNIKTHEKTAEIQTRMIMRLEKQKNDDDKIISKQTKETEELKQQCAALQKQCDSQHNDVSSEIEPLRRSKEALEARVAELEALLEVKSRPSLEAISESSRRRRQSLHDSKRLFGEDEMGDHNNLEAMFDSRAKPDDLFMDVDVDVSNRSSPMLRLSKGRDSLSLSRTDQSDKDDESLSRPSSVVATRRRRQSIHDLHRSVLRHTPSPHGLDSSHKMDDFYNSKPDTSGDHVSELSQLRESLASCHQELEELKEKYKELDEECETCAEYLRERDEQCSRLKKERTALQATVSELKEKLQSCSPNQTSKPSVADVGVNTDEDWTNLHSVVVDRMSYDAEVEKNKKLTKTIEDLRFRKQDLKNTLAKMQKALEKNSNNRELDSTRHELQACKQELSQLRKKYKELDEECETCAQYLREKEEQCRRLKEAKNALEVKLQEFEGDHNVKAHSTRKKRQILHDQNRSSTVDVKDATTETCDDFLSYQVERDGTVPTMSEDKQAKEMKRLKLVVEKLSQQKVSLEQQLVNMTSMHASHPAMYVATGSAIVQNQQLTDVMKENQKLKKINAKLVNICKKRGKDSNRENEDPADQG